MVNKIKLTGILIWLGVCSLYAQQTLWGSQQEKESIYNIQDSVMIRTRDGAEISAMVVRKKNDSVPRPVVLQFTIYVRDQGRDIQSLKEAADRGYVGVMAYTRGKRFSKSEIYPYETDGKDAYDVIDWISRQPWCNGKIGMYGGSYNGFTQWAAAKNLHPALKTIVPYVANRPGMGLPMENNIFINPNYEWSFYVGNNKYLDNKTGDDRQRFRNMMFKWWETGAAYHKMDSIDGTPNHLFQRWISHPAFDKYWQDMAPYKKDFARINIPVLAFDGYYNDSQNSGIYYLRELNKYSPQTPTYLVIGPYGHFGTQMGGQEVINGYTVSKNALFPIKEYTYQWLDYILKDAEKPAFLKDKINYQVMGTDEWRSAASLEAMHNSYLKFYLSSVKVSDNEYLLRQNKPEPNKYLIQKVDFADRTSSNNDYYPDPIIREIVAGNGYVFTSEPLDAMIVNGSFLGNIKLSINKKDVDLGLTLYELTPEGKYFHLSYYIGRASYTRDNTKRQLLIPGKKETITFENTHLISKQLQKGSRLVILLNVNKNPFSELNYGSGKTVTAETIADAKEPLIIQWFNDSFVEIPVLK
ncbi:putative CocE/NonD family hydrolase [Epilithonimonas hungarica]|uniref:CocE/NonD family hydrolase n=1 Tax=Epilithonimonas hungarica TaxID=454006 RepID=UPI0027892454|nr:CocE/NonD family hydrolase [Epilithonimonas hungarica]MDP9955468.1 putative CocE/NonD family hydrolase [Epilithonimonas hungarica]